MEACRLLSIVTDDENDVAFTLTLLINRAVKYGPCLGPMCESVGVTDKTNANALMAEPEVQRLMDSLIFSTADAIKEAAI